MGKLLDKYYSSINYSDYKRLRGEINLASLLSIAGTWISDSISSDVILLISWHICNVIGIKMTINNKEELTKDITEIREKYQELIKNYNELNRKFELENPIEIYTMYCYLLYRGYLSKDHKFKYETGIKDVKVLNGAYITSGIGVCRHIASFLTDVLNDYGIEAHYLGVHLGNFSPKPKLLIDTKYTDEELYDWMLFHNLDDLEKVRTLVSIHKLFIDIGIDFELCYEEKKKSFFKMRNHLITSAIQGNQCYFMDPTNSKVLTIDEYNKKILDDSDFKEIIKTDKLYGKDNYKKIQTMLKGDYTNVPREEINNNIKKTLRVCEANKYVFKRFYKKNKSLIKNIGEGLTKL